MILSISSITGLQNSWTLGIFIYQVRPLLKERAGAIEGGALPKSRTYVVPSGEARISIFHRSNQEIADVISSYWERGIFEAHIVTMVSLFEAVLQESIAARIKANIDKLSVIADAKAGVPLEVITSSLDRDEIIEKFVAQRCEEMMFKRPSFYIEKAKQVLEVPISEQLQQAFLEIKATRDIIIHNQGKINAVYLEKIGSAARGKLGAEIVINKEYFDHALNTLSDVTLAVLSGIRQRLAKKN